MRWLIATSHRGRFDPRWNRDAQDGRAWYATTLRKVLTSQQAGAVPAACGRSSTRGAGRSVVVTEKCDHVIVTTQGGEQAAETLTIPHESARALFLEMVFQNDQGERHVLSSGTGFYFRVDGDLYLITARHNVTGRAWRTNEILSTRGVEPNWVRIHLLSRDVMKEGSFDVELFEERQDGTMLPRWFEHPVAGADVDVVALPVNPPMILVDPPSAPRPVFVEPWEPVAMPNLAVTRELWIVGYPYGLRGQPLALWIRGTIASEPRLTYDNLPIFLIDSRTRAGQSGAPVVLYYPAGSIAPNPEKGQNPLIINADQSWLVGVYTGRINPRAINLSEDDANDMRKGSTDLGFVWLAPQLEDICRSRVRNPVPPIGA
jgi:trypsin-like peptidase